MYLPPLVVISLGNPAPYTNTLHSAGHVVINSLRYHLAKQWTQIAQGRAHPGHHHHHVPSSSAPHTVVRLPLHRDPSASTTPSSIAEAKAAGSGAAQPSSVNSLLVSTRGPRVKARAKHQRLVPEDSQSTSTILPPEASSSSQPFQFGSPQSQGQGQPLEANPKTGPGLPSPQPPFHLWRTRTTPTHYLSQSVRFRLHQCPTLMNLSGRFVHRIYHETVRSMNAAFQAPHLRHLVLPCPLVLLHDDLELPLGKVALKAWDSSAKGHNGVKSAHHALNKSSATAQLWYRVAIGIGRPEERTSDAVVEWVLREMTVPEQETLQKVAGPAAIKILEKIEEEVRLRLSGLGKHIGVEESERQGRDAAAELAKLGFDDEKKKGRKREFDDDRYE